MGHIIESPQPLVLINTETNYYLTSFRESITGHSIITTDNLQNAHIFWSSENINQTLEKLKACGVTCFKKTRFKLYAAD